MSGWRRGRLRPPGDAPREGERFDELLAADGVMIEQILSSATPGAGLYDQDADEWVLLLDGRASLEVDGQQVDLGPGDWLHLPAHTPHRVTSTAQGTRWLAVHLRP